VRHAHRPRRHPLLRGTALGTVAVLSFVAAGAATAYIRLGNNIETHDISALIAEIPEPEVTATPDPEDPNAGQALDILLMGSDVRDGENALLGGEEDGMRSDTTLIAHISADRTRMDLVSIPRDTRVDIPSCSFYDGSTSRAQSGRFNAAFSIGAKNDDVGEAAACTINTVQSLTGIVIDGWVVVDFAGFRDMVDALGGVEMCIPNDMESPKSGLSITAGVHVLDGYSALAYARARTGEGLGNGSDINRIARQQQLLGAIAQEVFASNLLTDSVDLYRFLTAATQSIAADPNTGSLTALGGLGWSLKDISPSAITFLTIPIATNPDDRNEVVFTSEANAIWTALINDVPMVPQTTPTDATGTADPTDPASTPVETTVPTPGVDPFTPADLPAICG